ncbi:MAG: glucose-6-phosphate isomerase family protein [Terrimesophilobacter sp.]
MIERRYGYSHMGQDRPGWDRIDPNPNKEENLLSKPPFDAQRLDGGPSPRPWSAHLDLSSGALWPPSHVVTCHLSEMAGRYADQAAEKQLLTSANPLIYRADEIPAPERSGELHTSVTVLYPGKVGDEYFMSKGHYHVREECVKVYLAVTGTGYLLMQTSQGDTMEVPMVPGTIVYCAAGWAQRTVNVGSDPFAYFKYWPGDSGHDYDRVIDEGGFFKRILDRDGTPTIVDAANVRPTMSSTAPTTTSI